MLKLTRFVEGQHEKPKKLKIQDITLYCYTKGVE